MQALFHDYEIITIHNVVSKLCLQKVTYIQLKLLQDRFHDSVIITAHILRSYFPNFPILSVFLKIYFLFCTFFVPFCVVFPIMVVCVRAANSGSIRESAGTLRPMRRKCCVLVDKGKQTEIPNEY